MITQVICGFKVQIKKACHKMHACIGVQSLAGNYIEIINIYLAARIPFGTSI